MEAQRIYEQVWEEAQATNDLVLGVDDFAIKKGHTYNTGIHNLRGESMLDLFPGRKLEDLRAYARQYPDFLNIGRRRYRRSVPLQTLAELREQDILIIGSGGTVHNLRGLNWESEETDGWAEQFDIWIQSKLESWDTEVLFKYRELAPYARQAVPTNEHFISLLLAMESGDSKREAELLHRSYQYGNLSLSCWKFN